MPSICQALLRRGFLSSGCFLGQQGLCLLSKGGGRGLPRGNMSKGGMVTK